jgi:hypothetical protein
LYHQINTNNYNSYIKTISLYKLYIENTFINNYTCRIKPFLLAYSYTKALNVNSTGPTEPVYQNNNKRGSTRLCNHNTQEMRAPNRMKNTWTQNKRVHTLAVGNGQP